MITGKHYLYALLCVSVCFLFTQHVSALARDADSDGLDDNEELTRYHTDPSIFDSDSDGYSDGVEIVSGYSPLNKRRVTLDQNDSDKDGLSDRFEIQFGTDLSRTDSDSDGYADRVEIWSGYDPRTQEPKKLDKHIEVRLKKQRLTYFANDIPIKEYTISSGKWNLPTPTGDFKIINKAPRAWSKLANLWMPYWMGFAGGKYGIHDLPEWPNGIKEGLNHLGKPVSHGCIRLGTQEAQTLYEWTQVGTKLSIRT